MPIRSIRLVGFILTATIGFSSQACAELVSVVFDGTVRSSQDPMGIFGVTGNNNVVGRHYVATYFFDLEKGIRIDDANEYKVAGGTYFGVTSPLVSAKTRIGNVTLPMFGGYYDYVDAFKNGASGIPNENEVAADAVSQYATTSGIRYNIFGNGVANFIGTIPISVQTDLHYTVHTSDITQGVIALGSSSAMTADNPATLIYADLTSVTIAPVPEPGTWAIFILGLGAVGAVVRHRQVAFAA